MACTATQSWASAQWHGRCVSRSGEYTGAGAMKRALVAIAFAAFSSSALAQDAAPQPHILGEGVISTRFNEFGGVLAPDGQTLYFSASVQPYYREETYVSHRTRAGWSEPVLAPFSRVARNFDVTFSPDGNDMLFV